MKLLHTLTKNAVWECERLRSHAIHGHAYSLPQEILEILNLPNIERALETVSESFASYLR